jgi:hypothetical protein
VCSITKCRERDTSSLVDVRVVDLGFAYDARRLARVVVRDANIEPKQAAFVRSTSLAAQSVKQGKRTGLTDRSCDGRLPVVLESVSSYTSSMTWVPCGTHQIVTHYRSTNPFGCSVTEALELFPEPLR